MKQREIDRIKAEADYKHLMAKLNEAEADALDKFSKAENKMFQLKEEIDACKSKREALETNFEKLKNATDEEWEKASNEYIASIEALTDKSIFKTKTEEWFRNIKKIANDFKSEIKDKVDKW